MKRILFVWILLVLISGVLGIEGVSPGSYEIGFSSNLEKDFVFDFVLDDYGVLSVEGDLAKYVELNKKGVVGRERVVAKLRLPEEVDGIGGKDVWIIAGNVRGLIRVNFGYPEKFVEMKVNVGSVNVGEGVKISLKVSNFGLNEERVVPVVSVYRKNGSDEEFVESFIGDIEALEGGENFYYEFLANGSKYFFGDYIARAQFKDYVGENIFRVGRKGIRILNYTKMLSKGVSRFDVEIENMGGKKLRKVWVEVRVIGRKDKGESVSFERGGGFDSSIVSLDSWERKNLSGYFDGKGRIGEAMLSLDVHFDDEVESEVVLVEIVNGFPWLLAVGVFLFFLICGFVLWKFWKGK